MKKAILSGFTAATLALTSGLHAEYREVGKAAADSAHAARCKQWQNILLATTAVAAAVTAIVLVAKHSGKN